MSIPFSSLPYINELFIDYIENYEKVSKYFNFDYKSFDDFSKCIEAKKHTYLKNVSFDRNDICDILRSQNQNFNSTDATLENIQLLHYENTFAVVTGQQIGFLTGPLYTVIKAINTVQLCDNLSKKFPEYNFVPVFWMEADDHDFREINNVSVIDKENEIKNIKNFEKGTEEEKYLKPAGKIVLDDYINNFIDEIKGLLQQTDFTDDILEKVKKAYKPGVDLKSAFANFFNSILGELGIILIDPSDDEIKKFSKPVFVKELYSFPETCEHVIDTSAMIEQEYPAQIKPQPINLFYIHNGNRYLIEPRDNEVFALKNSRQKFSKEELHSILDNNPERFSCNVVTRPIVQDYLLPTVAYIGGPSEIAYFAQLKKVYSSYNLTMPVIYPRTSVTMLEKKVKNFIDKYDIRFETLFYKDTLKKSLLNKIEDVNSEGIFSDMLDELNAVYYKYESKLIKIDKNLINTFRKKNEQYVDSLKVIKEKFINAQIRQSDIVSEQLEKNINLILPGNAFQERVLNIIYFLNKYSPELVTYLKKSIRINEFSHQLINLDLHPSKPENTTDPNPGVSDNREGSLFQNV
jgi:bacillithiol synthase